MQINIETNSITTDINNVTLIDLDNKSKSEVIELIDSVPFLKSLIKTNRLKTKDLSKKNGRIVVNIEEPHILENMEYFNERARYFEKHGRYTDIYPNHAPNSEYRKFWDEERRRCLEGYVRESDGEWISGYYYFYLNYTQIEKVEAINDDGNSLDSVRSERKEGFPRIWDGDYLFFHYVEQAESTGDHTVTFKCRGRGYSLKAAAMLARNYFIIKNSKSYGLASEQEYLTKDGLLSKAWSMMNFIDNNTPWSQPRDYKDTEIHKRASYKDVENKTERGFMSEIIGVTCKDNPNKARGKRGKILMFEEAGKFPGLSTSWSIARKSVEQGRYVYGMLCAFGTGGTRGADFESLERFFYSPKGYKIKALRNVFDKNSSDSLSALFIPEYLNREGCYDINGNSDAIKALVEILLQRQIVRLNTNDSKALTEEKAEAPITPQEAVLRVEGSIFPVQDLKEYLAEIMPNIQMFTSAHSVGIFTPDMSGSIKFTHSDSVFPIREFPATDNKRGAVEIFEMPVKTNSDMRYVIGQDVIDDDEVKYSDSLGSAICFDRYTRRIVCEFTGRFNTANEFYEVTYRMAKFYNAKIMYENNKKGMFAFCHNVKKDIHILADTPSILKDKQELKVSVLNTSKGVNATGQINAWARKLQADWMLEDAYDELGEFDEDGNKKMSIPNYRKIRSIGYLKECIAWNGDINCDRVSAMGMCLIYDAELNQYGVNVSVEKVKTLANDAYFNRFDNKFNSELIMKKYGFKV